MTQDNTLARSLHDLGLAAWFGGSLVGAFGLNGAAAVVDQPGKRQLTVLQSVIPGLTGAALVLNARMGEQQCPQHAQARVHRLGDPAAWPRVELAGGVLCIPPTGT